MKRWISLVGAAVLGSLTVLAWGQWQEQPQMDTRVGPIYPVNPSYNFYSERNGNYDPYRFNWATGQWDYFPFQGGPSSAGYGQEPAPPPYRPFMNQSTNWVYGAPPTTPQPYPATGSSPNMGAIPVQPVKPDDSDLWSPPATRPASEPPPKPVKFEGEIVAIKAVILDDDPSPHLLIRLKSANGATGTVDVGQRLILPDAAFDAANRQHVVAYGPLGLLDGRMVIFANQLSFGPQTLTINRAEDNPVQK